MKLLSQHIVVSGAVLVCLAITGLGYQQLHASSTPQPLALQDGADEAEAVPLGHGYERRGDFIYFGGERIDQAGRADLDRFEQWREGRVTPASGIDADSFVALSGEYTKDKNMVYYKHIGIDNWFLVVELSDADPASFEVLDNHLAKDRQFVWWNDATLPRADPASAEVVSGGMVWRDRNTVYYQSQPLPGADPKTIMHLGHSFHRDSERVYWGTDRLRDADAATFRAFGDTPYAADKNRVWFATSSRDDFDAASFRVFDDHVYADKDGVYATPRVEPVRGADLESFEALGPVGDKSCVLFRDRESLFVFENASHLEMYRISKSGGEIVLNKDIWRVRADGKTVRAAYISATWDGNGFPEPDVTIAPGFANSVFEGLETDKIGWLAETFKDAMRKTGYANEL